MRKVLISIFMLLALSCNFPGFPEILSAKKVTEPTTEILPETSEPEPKVDEPEHDDGADSGQDQDEVDVGSPTATVTATATPQATSTDAQSPDDNPTATHTATNTPTLTPTATETPTVKPTITVKATATSTPTNTPKVGPPLVFEDPAWELVEWHSIGSTGEWEGVLRAQISGGTPPYRSQLENQDIVNGLDIPVRWRLCKPMPATIRVMSADGQEIHKAVWVYEVGCP